MSISIVSKPARWLCTAVLVGLISIGFSTQVVAQFHGVAVLAACESPSKVGEDVSCIAEFRNIDDFGDTHEVREFWGVIDPAGLNLRFPPVDGSAPIVDVSAGTVCTPAPVGPDAPIGLVFPCDVPSDGDDLTPADFVEIGGTFTVPETATDPLEVQATAREADLCDDPDTQGCSTLENIVQQPAAINLFSPSISVTKTGPDVAKRGDEFIYTILVEDTSTGTGFPGFSSCTGDDPLLGGDLGAFIPGTPRDFPFTPDAGSPDPLDNTVTITCIVAGFENIVQDSDSHSVDLIDPAITVTKSGPATAKRGDEFIYTILVENTGEGAVENCTGNDALLGGDLGAFIPGTPRDFPFTPDAGSPDPLDNTVTITCDVQGFANTVQDSDSHSVDLIDPAITVTKSGPATAKRGDEFVYTILVENTGEGAVENCTGNDALLGGDLGAFIPGTPRDFPFTPDAGSPDPLDNTVTITCDVQGFANTVQDSDSHSVDLIDPAVTLTKECRPDPVLVGEQITWAITAENTGTGDLDCVLSDPDAGIDESFPLPEGTSESFNNSRMVTLDDVPLLSNTASVVCDVAGFNNQVDDSATADCVVEAPGEAICRTPGFWGTHAGTEGRGRATGQNLTMAVIDDAGGSIEVCGATIDNTDAFNVHSAVEAMCVRIEGFQQRQLGRQLTAMALNCQVSGFGADCSGDASLGALFAAANSACAANAEDLNAYIGEVDCFNNGGNYIDGVCYVGTCSATGDLCTDDGSCPLDGEGLPQTCNVFPDNCHDRLLTDSDIFDDVGGPAGSPGACRDANGNGIKVFPATE